MLILAHLNPQMESQRLAINDTISASKHIVVGIDLTGSEKKASGWALYQNGRVLTARIKTDQEIIAQTIQQHPDVIAIDARLTLPFGRISVFDDDPGRQEFGITRLCERLLLKRGIRSYPPLIKSMQRLTLRGKLLAKEFNQLGYRVIETFPGGCQDILGLTRKQKGLDELIAGIALLGLKGAYLTTKISHDEADAITAALAGLFFLDGQYEAIGDLEEGQIILPKLHDQTIVRSAIQINLSMENGIDKQRYPIGRFQKPNIIGQQHIQQWIKTIKEFPGKLNDEVSHLTEQDLEKQYRRNGWTIRQVVNHCADSHMNSFIRFKLALTEDEPTIKPYHEDLWAELPDTKIYPIASSLKILEGLHDRWVFMVEGLSEEDLQRKFKHPETNDLISLAANIGLYAWHCDHHLAHVKNAKLAE